MNNLAISQIILALAVSLMGIGIVLMSLKNIEQDKKIRCLEFGSVYVGDKFCSR